VVFKPIHFLHKLKAKITVQKDWSSIEENMIKIGDVDLSRVRFDRISDEIANKENSF
jgi:hypothetical protein